MTDSPATFQQLGRYDIVRVLGQGAMGVVYEGRDPNLDRRVAIKTVRVLGMATQEIAEYEERFKTEARSAGRLQHPNIVSVYDSDKHVDMLGQTAYIVMEFVLGKDLKHFFDEGRRFTLGQTLSIMTDLLAALDYAHKNSIIHRDIKPANLLLTQEGRIKLTDFGVARITDSGEITKTGGGIVGTLKYMSPEQVAGKGVDASSDLFSAGVVLYQLLTGERPFDGDGYLDIVSKIAREEPVEPSLLVSNVPRGIDALMSVALAKDKNDRFADAVAFTQALQAVMKDCDLSITPQPLASHFPEVQPTGNNPQSPLGDHLENQELEAVYWKEIKDSPNSEVIEAFLKRHPIGIHADLAKLKLKQLQQRKQAKRSSGAGTDTPQRKYNETTVPHSRAGSNSATHPITTTSTAAAATVAKSAIAPAAPAAPAASAAPASLSTTAYFESTVVASRGNDVSAFNDSEYGASTQFVPTQWSNTDERNAANASNLTPLENTALPAGASSVKRRLRSTWVVVVLVLSAAVGSALWWFDSARTSTTSSQMSSPASVATTGTPKENSANTVTSAAPAAPSTPEAANTSTTPASSDTVATASAILTGTETQPAVAPAAAPAAPAAAEPAKPRVQPAAKPLPRPAVAKPTTGVPPVSTPVATPVPAPVQPGQIVSEPGPPPEKPIVRAVNDPREPCANRIFLAYELCLARHCDRAMYKNHHICLERREMDRRRREQAPIN